MDIYSTYWRIIVKPNESISLLNKKRSFWGKKKKRERENPGWKRYPPNRTGSVPLSCLVAVALLPAVTTRFVPDSDWLRAALHSATGFRLWIFDWLKWPARARDERFRYGSRLAAGVNPSRTCCSAASLLAFWLARVAFWRQLRVAWRAVGTETLNSHNIKGPDWQV